MGGILGWFLMGIVGSIAIRILMALGFGVVGYIGIDNVMGWLTQNIMDQFGALPSNFMSILGIMQLDIAFNIIFAALGVRLLLAGVIAGAKSTLGYRGT